MRTISLFIIAILFTSAHGAAFAQISSMSLKAGHEHRMKFDNVKALEEYRKAAALDPGNAEVQAWLIQSLVDNGEDLENKESEKFYLEAVDRSQKFVEAHPDSALGFYLLALSTGKLALFKGGKEKVKLSRAVEQAALKSLELDDRQFKAHLLLGIYYRELANLSWVLKAFANTFFGGLPKGSNEDSIAELNRSLEIYPDYVRTHYEIGKTYLSIKQTTKAVLSFKKALSLPVVDHLDPMYQKEAAETLKKLGIDPDKEGE